MFNPPSRANWFVHDRFGLFIHWGLYAIPARGEWVRHVERLSNADYQPYFDHFDPDLYDPEVWAQEAAAAGMRYFVVTTKHHDGFCLWDSALTDYKAPRTPAGRDLLKPMVDAFRQQGLKVGFYHSLLDWHHDQFTVDGIHPQRNDPAFIEQSKSRDIRQYAAYLHGQTRELLTQFGKVDILWFDFSYATHPVFGIGKSKDDWQSEKLMAMVRELMPDVLVNDRLDIGGDIKTPEQYMPSAWMRQADGQPALWEACITMNDHWGYHATDPNWKSVPMLVQILVDAVSKGGNLLLNVGPTARGEFPAQAIERLRGIGAWMRQHSRSIYGCTASAFTPPPDCRYTQNGNRLYLHLFQWPYRHIHLPGLAGRVEFAQFLHDGAEVKRLELDPDREASTVNMAGVRDAVTLELPILPPPAVVPVIELFLK